MSASLAPLPPESAFASFRAIDPAGPDALQDIAEETPVAIAYNGMPHAVMMATPADLEDFATGFSLSEGVIAAAADIRAIAITPGIDDIQVDVALAPAALRAFLHARRRRSLRGHTSCGLCGIEDLDQLPHVTAARRTPPDIPPASIRRAVQAIRAFQPLSIRTRSAHAAAWVDPHGSILLAREDVGRHNALDKLAGACLRAATDRNAGFCLITSRCSFEMVQKAAAAGFPALVAMSAPTGRAIRAAETAGMRLVVGAAQDARICLPAAR